jgi:hypothetical protein
VKAKVNQIHEALLFIDLNFHAKYIFRVYMNMKTDWSENDYRPSPQCRVSNNDPTWGKISKIIGQFSKS